MTREEAIRLLDLNREYLKNTNNIGLKDDIKALDMAIQALKKENIYDDKEHYVTISKALYDKLNIDYEQALSQEPTDENLHREREQAYMQGYEDASKKYRQEPCEDWYDVPSDEMTLEQARQAVKDLRKKLAEHLEQEPCDNAISRSDMLDAVGHGTTYTSEEVQKIVNNLPPVTPQAKEQEPCEDAISREDATAEFIRWQIEVAYAFGRDYSGVRIIQSAIDTIRELPSVTPKPKTGYWLRTGEVDVYYDLPAYECSKCGQTSLENGDYCPNCGARMESERMNKEVIIDIENPKDNDLISRQAVIKCLERGDTLSSIDHRLIDKIKRLPSVNPQPCEDAISRDMALEKMADYVASGYADSAEDFEEYSKIICQLPSVTQKPETVTEFADRCRECGARYGKLLEQKRGKWVRQTDDYHDYYECEYCGIAVGIDDIKNFCPNCGAKMEE